MKKLLFILLFPVLGYAEGPIMSHKDTITQQEFENVYKDIRSKQISATASGDVCIDNPTFCVDADENQIEVTDGTSATPVYSFDLDDDTGMYRANTNVIGFSANGEDQVYITDGTMQFSNMNVIRATSGTINSPAYSFDIDTNTGFIWDSADYFMAVAGGLRVMDFSPNQTVIRLNGDAEYQFDSTGLYPADDNARKLGQSGDRWSEVWAANGTIQTSSSRRKRQIREIRTNRRNVSLQNLNDRDTTVSTYTITGSSITVPRGIVYKWKGREGRQNDKDIIGFVGDDLPEEARAIKEDGTRDEENFYLSAVVGLLSAKIRELEARIEVLEAN